MAKLDSLWGAVEATGLQNLDVARLPCVFFPYRAIGGRVGEEKVASCMRTEAANGNGDDAMLIVPA